MIRLGLVAFLVIPFLSAPPAQGSCFDPAWCYCGLKPGSSGEVLIRAEVLQKGELTSTLRVQGVPFYDPEGSVSSGQILENLGYRESSSCSVGDYGIFLVDPTEGWISFYVIEQGGRYLCFTDSDFPGVNMEELAQLALSDNCWDAARALGIESDCKDIVSGCCNTERTTFSNSAPLILVLGFLVPRNRSRKAPKGRST
jgi:hypothetical protein